MNYAPYYVPWGARVHAAMMDGCGCNPSGFRTAGPEVYRGRMRGYQPRGIGDALSDAQDQANADAQAAAQAAAYQIQQKTEAAAYRGAQAAQNAKTQGVAQGQAAAAAAVTKVRGIVVGGVLVVLLAGGAYVAYQHYGKRR